MYSLIEALPRLTGLPDETLGIELAQRNDRYPIPAATIADWRGHELPRPVWVQRAAARWIGELWRAARAACPPEQRAAVDARYAAALDPALGEVYRLLGHLDQAPGPVPAQDLRAALQPLVRILGERLQRKLEVVMTDILRS